MTIQKIENENDKNLYIPANLFKIEELVKSIAHISLLTKIYNLKQDATIWNLKIMAEHLV